jgi:hypothetical protein
MQHIAVSAHDAARALRGGDLAGAARALGRKGNGGSIHSVLEQIPWLLKF